MALDIRPPKPQSGKAAKKQEKKLKKSFFSLRKDIPQPPAPAPKDFSALDKEKQRWLKAKEKLVEEVGQLRNEKKEIKSVIKKQEKFLKEIVCIRFISDMQTDNNP